ncbi:polysaccharide pyruvyl transferase family protein [Janibacter sp. G56]|uniref:polysaccharide pyruvyl transferase family protein n=1 Tax=Janibacter sp. G56 TaxID=3418717 RepID=UPI003CFD6C18
MGIGSLIEQLPDDFSGDLWGTGLLRGQPRTLPLARPLAVRGPLTKALLGITDDIALGDPGILVARHARRGRMRWRLGVLPHGLHRDDAGLRELAVRGGDDVRVIDVRSRPSAVIGQISHCGAVLTTSLHGLIVADALGIPAVWTQREPLLWGGRFKFDDYEAVLTPGWSREVDVDEVNTMERVLAHADIADRTARDHTINRLEGTLPHLRVTEASLWEAHRVRQSPANP